RGRDAVAAGSAMTFRVGAALTVVPGRPESLAGAVTMRTLLGGLDDRMLVGRLARASSPATLQRRFFLPGRWEAEQVLARYGRYLLAGPPDGLALAAMLGDQPVGLLNLAP